MTRFSIDGIALVNHDNALVMIDAYVPSKWLTECKLASPSYWVHACTGELISQTGLERNS